MSNETGRSQERGETNQRQLAKAMAHPVQSRVLNAVAEATFIGLGPRSRSKGITVRQTAERIGEPPRRVRYHLDALRREGIVAIAEERKLKAVVERYFIATHLPMLSDEEITALPQAEQRKMLIECIKAIFADATASLSAGLAVTRPGWAAGRVVGEVDEQGWEEIGALHIEMARVTQKVIAESQDRMALSGDSPIRITSASMFLEAPHPDVEKTL